MFVSGLGIVFNRGRGIGSLETALQEGWRAPEQNDAVFPCYRVDDELLKDKTVLRGMRRADRFSKMAVLAAYDALRESGTKTGGAGERVGIIIATGFGPHATTFRFLDDIIDYDDANVSPTTFSHSVHNAAASYIALSMQCYGPTLTVTNFAHSFFEALLLARTWLNENRCSHVVLAAVDELSPAMEYIAQRKLHQFEGDSVPAIVPGEGSVSFVLSKERTDTTYCELLSTSGQLPHDVTLVNADGISMSGDVHSSVLKDSLPVSSYTPLFGSMMIGNAFHCVVAALMMQQQIQFAVPVTDNPHNVAECAETRSIEMQSINCVQCHEDGTKEEIVLRR